MLKWVILGIGVHGGETQVQVELRRDVKSKKQLAYDGIKKIIRDGQIRKDVPLVERRLCENLGISRTPIREALRELENEGLLEVIEGKGIYVKRIEFREMVEIFEVREALERMAVKLYVERAQDEDLELFQKYMEEQEEAYKKDKHDLFMQIDMKIHMLIAESAQNIRLKKLIQTIYDQVQQMAISAKDDACMRDIAIRAHRRILAAVLKRDGEEAQRAIVQHIVETKNIHKDLYYLL